MADILPTCLEVSRLCVEPTEQQVLRLSRDCQREDSQDGEARQDARLLSSIAEGDEASLAVLYRRRGSLLYSLLVRMLGSDMEAQEVMQDTFVQIWRRAAE